MGDADGTAREASVLGDAQRPALRCGQQVPGGVRLQAGGGMVPGAVPEEEVTEIRAKFLPMRRALGVAED